MPLKLTAKEEANVGARSRLKGLYKHFGSREKVAGRLGIPRMTVWRWIKKRKIDNCYLHLIHYLINVVESGISTKNDILDSQVALTKLEEYKKNTGSWDQVAKKLGMAKNKKTIMRWRKTGKISKAYLRLLYYFFKERPVT